MITVFAFRLNSSEVQLMGYDPDELLGGLHAEGQYEFEPHRDGTANGEK